MLVDNVPLATFGYKDYHEQIAAVLQDDSLFAGSIADNVALFDDSPELERVMEAARLASVDEEIARMPMGYETLVGDMGSTLSGGQKQRVLLARALYRRPRLIVIDEGTSHLDTARERAINSAVSELGITRIIVAHRAETIRATKKIYRMERGRLAPVQHPDSRPGAPGTQPDS